MMVCFSAIIHLAVYFFFLEFRFPAHFKEAPVYYVDILDLPVANPQAGTSAKAGGPQPPSPPAAPVPREMIMPAKPSAGPKPAPPQKKPESVETSREFEERIARLEHEAAARHEEAAIAALMKKGATRGPAGMPGATGTEAGSDYASYIQSRLKDAFRATIAFQSKNPQVVVRITISRSGHVVRIRTERSSGDKVFEDSVTRAIANAEKNFTPPPTGEEFETGFVFRPQGVGKN